MGLKEGIEGGELGMILMGSSGVGIMIDGVEARVEGGWGGMVISGGIEGLIP